MRATHYFQGIATLWLSSAAAALAADVTEADLLGHIDLAVPDVPAANVLGMSPDTVIRPTTGKDFAAGLLNGVGQDGKLQAGVALDIRPALFIAPGSFSLANYRDMTQAPLNDGTPFERYRMKRGAYWTKLRTSFATGRTEAGGGDADRYAFGASFNIFDHGDSRLSPTYRNCVIPVLDDLNKQAADALAAVPIGDTAGEERVRKMISAAEADGGARAIKECARKFEETHWNADSWDVGAAYFDFDTPQVRSSGFATWTTYARHIGSNGQLIFHLRWQDDEVATDPKDEKAFVVQDAFIGGARLRWKAPGGALMLEATYRDLDRKSGEDDSYTLASIGYEFRVAEGLWLQVATGKAYGTNAFDNDEVFSGQLRWGRSDKSLLAN